MTTATLEKPAAIAVGRPDLGVYVACLASYNNGHLHGAWVDLDGCSRDGLDEAMAWVLATSPEPGAEEWAIHDFSGFPSFLTRSEWPDLDQLLDYSKGLAEHHHGEAYRLACENAGQVLDFDEFTDAYMGTSETVEDFAIEWAIEGIGIDIDAATWPFSCIDWAHAWRELEVESFHCERGSDGELYFFRN